MSTRRRNFLALVASSGLALGCGVAQAQLDTVFTYQGLLSNGNSTVNGTVDVRVTVFDSSVGGNAIAGPFEVLNVDVDEGLFSVELDLGSQAFAFDDRYLEIEIRNPAGGGAYATLNPRQPVTSSPRSLQTRGLWVTDFEDVRIGTSTLLGDARLGVFENDRLPGWFRRNSTSGPFTQNLLELVSTMDGTSEDGLGGRLQWRVELDNNGLSSVGSIDVVVDDVSTGDQTKSHMEFRTRDGILQPLERMRITHDGRVLIGREDVVSLQEFFGVTAPTGPGEFGGMYIDTTNATGLPFYGYATGGEIDGYHYIDSNGAWRLFNGGSTNLTVDGDGNVGINDTTPDARLDVVQSNGGTAIDVTATNNAVGLHMDTSTPDQIPAFWLEATGNAWPMLVDVQGGISNIARFNLDNSTSAYAAFEIEADTQGPALRVIADGTGSALAAIGADSSLIVGQNFTGVNRSSRITSSEVFGITANTAGFGGMYAETTDPDGEPFYGYSAGGDVDAFSYYDGDASRWVLNVGGGDRIFVRSLNGYLGIGDPVPAFPIDMASGAHVTVGGVWTNASSREWKQDFEAIDPREILDRVAELDISEWSYKTESGVRHIGPVAEEFAKLFDLGGDVQTIGTVDADGVALAAIQGLHEVVIEKDLEIDNLEARVAELESLVRQLVGETK